jgi:hypothetical protein
MQAKASMPAPVSEGPDFLCIGQQRAGSTWLFDQLKFHPNLWLPPAKALHYLDGRFPDATLLKAAVAASCSIDAHGELSGARAKSDRAFFAAVRAALNEPHSLDVYARLFRFKGERLAGEITPTYCNLDVDDVRSLLARFPFLKVILLVRDPIERLWSEVSDQVHSGILEPDVLSDPRRFERFLAASPASRQSFATHIAQTWLNAIADGEQVFMVCFDEIVTRPRAVLREVLSFLGVYPFFTGPLALDLNRKEGARKSVMPSAIRRVLISHFAEELYASGEMFGGAAKSWPARYGLN